MYIDALYSGENDVCDVNVRFFPTLGRLITKCLIMHGTAGIEPIYGLKNASPSRSCGNRTFIRSIECYSPSRC